MLMNTWKIGLCIANILVLDRGPREVHQSSDLASRMEVEDAAYRIVAECMLRQNAGGKMVIGEIASSTLWYIQSADV